MSNKAKRRITKFNFEKEGAHLSLVDKAANLQEVLVMKALEQPEKNLSSSVESQDEDVSKKAEDETLTEKGTTPMSEDTKKELSVEEQIAKAVEAQRKEIEEQIAKQYEDKFEESTKELQILKSLEEKRQEEIYKSKAEAVAKFLGEDTDKVELAKALRKAEKDEELAPLMKAFAELKDSVSKEDLLVEKGASKTEDQPSDEEAMVIAKSKEYVAKGMDKLDADLKAYEEVHGLV